MTVPIDRVETNGSVRSDASPIGASQKEYVERDFVPPQREYTRSLDSSRPSSRDGSSTIGSGESSEEGRFYVLDRLDNWFGGRMELEPALQRRHIMMISIGGTVGMGLLLTSSKILYLGGSTGLIVSYAMVGLVVAAVMSCIAEMVSLIPEPGAISLFPRRFVDHSLGFAVGVTYWFTCAIATASLTAATTNLSTYWGRDVLDIDLGWRVTVFLLVLIGINVMGVKVYSEVEHFFGWLKILMVVGLTLLMLMVSSGVNAKHGYLGTKYWREDSSVNPYIDYRMPPDYARDHKIEGVTARFLAVWSGMTLAAFSYVGVEIAAVTAGEAKYPRKDIAFAMRFVFLITIGLYVFSVIFASLCVPWTDENLWRPGTSEQKDLGRKSPFLIAIVEAGYSPALQTIVNIGFLFSAWTAANNNLYAASRTLYGMCQGMTKKENPILWPLGRTRLRNGAPVIAILVSCIFTPLSYLMCKGQNGEEKMNGLKLLDITTRLGTVGCLMVWGSHCLAFLRFYFGLNHSIWTRSSDSYPYRSKFQPFTAIFGLTACFLLVFFNGWVVFYNKPFSARDFIAAYLWPIVFAALYLTHKLYYKTDLNSLSNLDYSYVGPEEQPAPSYGFVRSLFEFQNPMRRKPAQPPHALQV